MNNDLLYQIALTHIPHIGDVHARALINVFGDAASIFKARKDHLENIEGIGSIRAGCIRAFNNFSLCEEEISFIERYKIIPLFFTDAAYPKRLLNCYDSPAMLYYRGTADLNNNKFISIVGTRNHSEYGKMLCEKLVDDLKEHHIVVLSGLAFGIDTIAHKSALRNDLETVAVLAHGLDRIYPHPNKNLAKLMTAQGGLLSDFTSNTNPDKQNFPRRNRIVAGMCDALVVIESGVRGGSLITAELANSYNKDVFAFPGKVTDTKSEGCNYLIKNNKASLITSATDLLDLMNWTPRQKKVKKQRELFLELTSDEKLLLSLFTAEEPLKIDQLYLKSNLSSSAVASALLTLEMQGVVTSMPGKVYKLN